MPHFEIVVQHKSGQVATQARVVLSGSLGQSDPEHTDRNGRVVVEHSSTSPTIFVNGKDKGKARPGKNVVTI